MKNSINKMLAANMQANLYEMKEKAITGVNKLDHFNNTLFNQEN